MPYPITQFKNRLRFVAVCCLLLFLSLSTACSHPGGSLPLPAGNVRPDADFNRLFTRHGGGWTGGDGTLSIPLPDGRSLWLFGDTFLGRVRSDGTRSVESPLIRNSLVVQDGRKLTTHYGGTRAAPEAFLVPQEPDAWYWPGDGTVQKNRLQILLLQKKPHLKKQLQRKLLKLKHRLKSKKVHWIGKRSPMNSKRPVT